ncbi:unnamed protein product [Musa banksii]
MRSLVPTIRPRSPKDLSQTPSRRVAVTSSPQQTSLFRVQSRGFRSESTDKGGLSTTESNQHSSRFRGNAPFPSLLQGSREASRRFKSQLEEQRRTRKGGRGGGRRTPLREEGKGGILPYSDR